MPSGLFDQREQQMFGFDLRVIVLFGDPLRRQNRFLRLFGVLVQIHIDALFAFRFTQAAELLPPANFASAS